MTERNIKWKPELDIIYENKLIVEPIKFKNKIIKNKIIKNKKIKNKKTEINDLAVECFEF